MRRLIAHRVILDRKMLYWYARPSEHLPNLEVRIADTNADADPAGHPASRDAGWTPTLRPAGET